MTTPRKTSRKARTTRRTASADPSVKKKSAAPEVELSHEFPEFHGRLKSALADKGLTLAGAAREAQISRPTAQRIARLQGNPLLSNLVHISRAVGVPVPELLGQQRGVQGRSKRASDPLLGLPPRADPVAFSIYEMLCKGTPMEEVRIEAEQHRFPMAGEDTDDAIIRAVLDILHEGHVWIESWKLPRGRSLEKKIAKKYDLEPRDELRDPSPVRVVDIGARIYPLIQLHAVAAVAAAIVKELLSSRFNRIGFADGFMSSAVQMYLRRGDLNNPELIPLVISPHFAQFELSGATLIGSLARTHQGYRVRSAAALHELPKRLEHVQVAVTSCGSSERETRTRLARLVRHGGGSYTEFLSTLKKHWVVGDLMYHFLRKNGSAAEFPQYSQDLERLSELKDLDLSSNRLPEDAPLVYTASLKSLANIAERGVSMLLVHSSNRAPVVHAALQKKKKERPVNLLVLTKAAAVRLLEE